MIKQKNMFVNNAKRGFTLIELLIVIAILGVLAVVVLVAINPVQQLARTRDSGRKSSVTQIGHALSAYYTARNGAYPTEGNTYLTTMVTAGEIASAPSAVTYSAIADPGCAATAAVQNGWCYDYDATAGTVVVYTILESNVEDSKCATATDRPAFVYSSVDGRGGLVCVGAAAFPAAGAQTWNATQ
jgi:prepilin-type N-terminal cleavage/methylation domain-containing protein